MKQLGHVCQVPLNRIEKKTYQTVIVTATSSNPVFGGYGVKVLFLLPFVVSG